jgi:hypothetical protein
MYRPDNWINLYGGCSEQEGIFEAGADAILEALKEQHIELSQCWIEGESPFKAVVKGKTGYLVFIPD